MAGNKEMKLPEPPKEEEVVNEKHAVESGSEEPVEDKSHQETEEVVEDKNDSDKEVSSFGANLPADQTVVRQRSFLTERTGDGMWKIKKAGGGVLPVVLRGRYTNLMQAEAAIAKFLEKEAA